MPHPRAGQERLRAAAGAALADRHDGPRAFRARWLSLDETRRQAAAAFDYRACQTRAQREGADRQLRQAESAFERMRGHFKAGELDPDDWRLFRDEFTEDIAASRAERDRLAAQEATLSGDDRRLDDQLAEFLNAIRCAIVGLVRDHDTVDAVRVALGQLFESFTLYTDTDGTQYVDPMVRRDAIDRIADGRVELRRVPLETAWMRAKQLTASPPRCSSRPPR